MKSRALEKAYQRELVCSYTPSAGFGWSRVVEAVEPRYSSVALGVTAAGRLRSPEQNGVAGQSAMAAIESVEVRVDGIHSDLNRLSNTHRARFATLAIAHMHPRRVARLFS